MWNETKGIQGSYFPAFASSLPNVPLVACSICVHSLLQCLSKYVCKACAAGGENWCWRGFSHLSFASALRCSQKPFFLLFVWRNCWKPTKILNRNTHKVFFTQLNIFLGTFRSYLLHWKLSLHDYVLSFAALVVYCTKSRRAERYWQKTLLQMEEMESQIREEIRKGVFIQEPTNLHTNSHFL